MTFDFLAISGLIVGVGLFISSMILAIKLFLFLRRNHRDQLITYGMYCHIRHPSYLPVLMVLASLFVMYPDLVELVMLLFSVVVIHLSIRREESRFIERYGDEYREYMKKVPWKLIPNLY